MFGHMPMCRYTLREAEWLASLCGLPPVSEEGQEQGGKAPELPPAPALETVLAVGTDTVERRVCWCVNVLE